MLSTSRRLERPKAFSIYIYGVIYGLLLELQHFGHSPFPSSAIITVRRTHQRFCLDGHTSSSAAGLRTASQSGADPRAGCSSAGCSGADSAGGNVTDRWSSVAGTHFQLLYLHLVEQACVQSVVVTGSQPRLKDLVGSVQLEVVEQGFHGEHFRLN